MGRFLPIRAFVVATSLAAMPASADTIVPEVAKPVKQEAGGHLEGVLAAEPEASDPIEIDGDSQRLFLERKELDSGFVVAPDAGLSAVSPTVPGSEVAGPGVRGAPIAAPRGEMLPTEADRWVDAAPDPGAIRDALRTQR